MILLKIIVKMQWYWCRRNVGHRLRYLYTVFLWVSFHDISIKKEFQNRIKEPHCLIKTSWHASEGGLRKHKAPCGARSRGSPLIQQVGSIRRIRVALMKGVWKPLYPPQPAYGMCYIIITIILVPFSVSNHMGCWMLVVVVIRCYRPETSVAKWILMTAERAELVKCSGGWRVKRA